MAKNIKTFRISLPQKDPNSIHSEDILQAAGLMEAVTPKHEKPALTNKALSLLKDPSSSNLLDLEDTLHMVATRAIGRALNRAVIQPIKRLEKLESDTEAAQSALQARLKDPGEFQAACVQVMKSAELIVCERCGVQLAERVVE